jgi:hypothetical protein
MPNAALQQASTVLMFLDRSLTSAALTATQIRVGANENRLKPHCCRLTNEL